MPLLVLTGCISSQIKHGPDETCINRLDSSDVIQIAKRHRAWFQNHWIAPASMLFNENECVWIVTSYKIGYSRKGSCAHTNGCTTSKKVTLVIDARTRKVKSRKKEFSYMPNYE